MNKAFIVKGTYIQNTLSKKQVFDFVHIVYAENKEQAGQKICNYYDKTVESIHISIHVNDYQVFEPIE